MTATRPEVALANLIWFGAWDAGVLLLVVLGRRTGTRLAAFRARVVAQWRPALALAALTLIGLLARDVAVGTDLLRAIAGYLLLPVGVFAQALIGLALARGIPKFEPLPLSAPAAPRQHMVRTLVVTSLITVIAAPVGLVLGSIGTSLGASLAHETVRSQAVTSQFPANPVVVFLMLLAGAGIAEEVVYRLVILSLVWRLTGRSWVAVIVAAVLHGLYHLTPLDGFYAQFWQYPVAQVVGTIGISVVWGVLYVKRGLESAIVGHTLADWIGIMFLLR